MRDLLTSILEMAGLLLLCVAAGVAVAQWSSAAGFATTGLLLLGASALVTARDARAASER